jgi:hypothetical protein
VIGVVELTPASEVVDVGVLGVDGAGVLCGGTLAGVLLLLELPHPTVATAAVLSTNTR